MKKILGILLIAAMCFGAFAQEKSAKAPKDFNSKFNYLYGSFNAPFRYQGPDDANMSYDFIGIGGAINAGQIYNNKIGYYINIEYAAPLNLHLTNEKTKKSVTVTQKDVEYLFTLSALFGPTFVLTKSEKVKLMLSPAIHVSLLSIKLKDSASSALDMGVGVNFSAWFMLGNVGFITVGVDGFFDFLERNMTTGASGNLYTVGVTPKVGFGFRY